MEAMEISVLQIALLEGPVLTLSSELGRVVLGIIQWLPCMVEMVARALLTASNSMIVEATRLACYRMLGTVQVKVDKLMISPPGVSSADFNRESTIDGTKHINVSYTTNDFSNKNNSKKLSPSPRGKHNSHSQCLNRRLLESSSCKMMIRKNL